MEDSSTKQISIEILAEHQSGNSGVNRKESTSTYETLVLHFEKTGFKPLKETLCKEEDE